MYDPRIQKLAKLLVQYSAEVKPDQWVVIFAGAPAMPLATAAVEEIAKVGAHADVIVTHDDFTEASLRHSSLEQLDWTSPMLDTVGEKADVFMALRAPTNTRALTGIAPQKSQVYAKARRRWIDKFYARTAKGESEWTLTQYPCAAYAQEADMSIKDYAEFIFSAALLNHEDPVAEWQKVHAKQQVYVDYLKGKESVTVKGPHIDMTLSIADRTFVNASGKRNMPDGEIFTGPVEDSVNGWVDFTYPAVRDGREVEGVRFEFKDGKLINASANKNEDYLLSQLDADEGARYLGEFAIGTNYGIQQFTKTILFDEKIGGTLHMAVGNGYPETGSVNKSSVHWDFICDMRQESEIHVDGELIYQNGQFLID